MKQTPLVSVVLATFNEHPNVLKQAVNSIIQQDFDNWEMLIIDDSTSQETIAAIDTFDENPKIHIVRCEQRRGFVNSLNYGLLHSRGKYIARMDGDDISLPNRFSKQVKFLEGNKDIAILGGSINIMNQNGEIVSERKYPTTAKAIRRYMVFRSPLAHPTVMMRREIVDNGFLYNPELKKAEDIELWLRVVNAGYEIGNLEDPILNYRVTGSLANKRSKKQWLINYSVRKSNFSAKHLLFSMASICVSKMYCIVPNALFELFYKKENKM